jgi:serine/threonine protein kinase
MSDAACDLLSGLLERDPDDRFGGEELMGHEWFAGIDWKLLLEKKSMGTNRFSEEIDVE